MVGYAVLVATTLTMGCGRLGFDGLIGFDALAMGSCPTFADFCDGFESGDTSAWSDTSATSGATVTVETAIVHSGSYAADAVVPPGADGDHIRLVHTIATPAVGVVAVRAWIYQPQPLIMFDAVLDVFGQPRHADVNGGGDATWTVTESDDSAGVSDDHHSVKPVAERTWTCVELDYTAGSPATIELFIDDVVEVTTPAIDPLPEYSDAGLGVPRADAAGSRTIVDDVVVARQHIGC